MATKKPAVEPESVDTARHDLHGDTAPSAPEQAHERGYEETLHGVPAVPADQHVG